MQRDWEYQEIARQELTRRGFGKLAESPELRTAVVAAAQRVANEIRSESDGTYQ